MAIVYFLIVIAIIVYCIASVICFCELSKSWFVNISDGSRKAFRRALVMIFTVLSVAIGFVIIPVYFIERSKIKENEVKPVTIEDYENALKDYPEFDYTQPMCKKELEDEQALVTEIEKLAQKDCDLRHGDNQAECQSVIAPEYQRLLRKYIQPYSPDRNEIVKKYFSQSGGRLPTLLAFYSPEREECVRYDKQNRCWIYNVLTRAEADRQSEFCKIYQASYDEREAHYSK